MTVLESLKLATEYLEKHNIENPRLNAELLLSEILHCKRLDLYTHFEKPLKEDEMQQFRNFILRRSKGEPVQYIIGKAYFYGLEFIVSPDVLIPRSDTELLVEEIIHTYPEDQQLKILDICSGSGNIGITLAKHFRNAKVLCIDVSSKSIEIGKLNSQKLNVENIEFLQIDIFSEFQFNISFNVIVSNPPYISFRRKDSLQREVRLYEPYIALFVDDEMKFYRRIIDLSEKILINGGKIFFEIDHEFADRVYELLEAKKFRKIKLIKDYANLYRIISGEK